MPDNSVSVSFKLVPGDRFNSQQEIEDEIVSWFAGLKVDVKDICVGDAWAEVVPDELPLCDTPETSFRFVVCTGNEYSGNSERFGTPQEAKAAGRELAGRWMSVRSFAVIPSDTPADTNEFYWSRDAIEKAAIGEIVKA